MINERENNSCSLFIVSKPVNSSSLFKISSEVMLTHMTPIIQIGYTKGTADILQGGGYRFARQTVGVV